MIRFRTWKIEAGGIQVVNLYSLTMVARVSSSIGMALTKDSANIVPVIIRIEKELDGV
jgi:hypothetical protein